MFSLQKSSRKLYFRFHNILRSIPLFTTHFPKQTITLLALMTPNYFGLANFSTFQVQYLDENSFEKVRELGKSCTNAIVSLVRHKESKILLAQKSIYLDVSNSTISAILMEIQALHRCNCKNIVGQWNSFYSPINNLLSSLDIRMFSSGGLQKFLYFTSSSSFSRKIPVRKICGIVNSFGFFNATHY